MTDPLLLASQRTMQMIGRTDVLERVYQALYHPEHDGLTVLAIHGPGGIGKSRLAEEILLQSGNDDQQRRRERGMIAPAVEPMWHEAHLGALLAPDLLDMNDLRLHGQLEFMRSLADHITHAAEQCEPPSAAPVYFNTFNDAYNEVRKGHQRGLSHHLQQGKVAAAEAAFLDAYRRTAKEHRILLVIDTFEKLGYYHTDWLLGWNTIKKEDLQFAATYWLEMQIAAGRFPNTLLLLFGRAGEDSKLGRGFLERVKKACRSKTRAARRGAAQGAGVWETPIRLPSFGLEETTAYFQRLQGDLAALAQDDVTERLSQQVRDLLNDTNRLETLTIYTGGLPVRLALYGALLAENTEVPQRLMEPPALARKHSKSELEAIRAEISDSFIELLFNSIGLRTAFLNLLIAAPRGLDWDQLYLCVNGFAYDPGREERELEKRNTATDQDQRYYAKAEVEAEFNRLHRLSIVKIRPGGRLALQDAIYEAFEKMSPTREPFRKVYKAQRKKYYQRLYDDATKRLAALEAKRRAHLEEEEQELQRNIRATMLPVQLAEPPESKLEELIENAREINHWEMEQLHYALLNNLVQALNDVVFELSHKNYRAQNEEADFRSLEEVYQVLYSESLLRLLDLGRWPAIEEGNEKDPEINKIKVLQRFMQQAEVTRWLQRLILRSENERALELLDDVEKEDGFIARLKPEERNSWLHSFSVGERRIWWAYLQAMTGNHQIAIDTLTKHIRRLEQLLQYPHSKNVPNDAATQGRGGRAERGFADHPARRRMIRVIALAYNNLGYAYVSQGMIDQSINSYTKALKLLRIMEFAPLISVTLNNLSRALSDKGRGRARRVCLDGLRMTKESWADTQVANSYNTLALIDNDQSRPQDARASAAVAAAYFERAQDERGLGLAYLQFGEALRRIAVYSERTGTVIGQEPGRLFDEAERPLQRATRIFTQGRPKTEIVRQVESFIEFGCLLRDRMEVPVAHNRLNEALLASNERYYSKAGYYLKQAAILSNQNGWSRLELDATINMAWMHFTMLLVQRNALHNARSDDECLGFKASVAERQADLHQTIFEAEQIIPAHAQIAENQPLPQPDFAQPYFFQQLSKLEGLRARIEMEEFQMAVHTELEQKDLPRRRQQEEESDFFAERDQIYQEILTNEEIARRLRQAMEAYTRALIYADLYSPRSGSISLIYNSVYQYLNAFNPREMEYAYRYAVDAASKYRIWRAHPVGEGAAGELVYLEDIKRVVATSDLPSGSYAPSLASVSILSNLPQFIAESIGAFTEEDFRNI